MIRCFLPDDDRTAILEALDRAGADPGIVSEVLNVADGAHCTLRMLSLLVDGHVTPKLDNTGELRWSLTDHAKCAIAEDVAAACLREADVVRVRLDDIDSEPRRG